jgi:hypothetical protein
MPDGLLKRVDMAFRPELFVNHYGSSEIYIFAVEPRAAAKRGSAGKAGLNQRIWVVPLGADSADARAMTAEEWPDHRRHHQRRGLRGLPAPPRRRCPRLARRLALHR